jgi:hypothetical protein
MRVSVPLLCLVSATFGRVARADAPEPPPAPVQPAAESPAEVRLRALGEELYKRDAIEVVGDEAYQGVGRGRRPLEGADFYATVGRPDLAARYRDVEGNKNLARGIGGVTIGVGVLWGLGELLYSAADTVASAIPCTFSGGSGSQDNTWCNPHQASGVPWGVAVLGLVLVAAPSAVSSHPVSESERRQLIERYNAELRARAGLGAPRPTVRLAPVLTPGGGGMLLSGRF